MHAFDSTEYSRQLANKGENGLPLCACPKAVVADFPTATAQLCLESMTCNGNSTRHANKQPKQ
jgi:hypothetical protein